MQSWADQQATSRLPGNHSRAFLPQQVISPALRVSACPVGAAAQQQQIPQDAINRALESSYFSQRELTNMPVPFALEQMFTKCVQTGNTAELKRLLDTYLSGTAGTLSSTPLRQSKDTSIAIAAVISRAAIAGGLSAESACRLSDVYVQQMETCGEVKDVYMLCARMVFDLTERVANVQRQTAYSFPITQCIQFITDHLHEELSLSILADQVQLSPPVSLAPL